MSGVRRSDRLLVDRRRRAVVPELVDTAGVALEIGHHAVGLGAGEVVDVDSDPGHWANLLATAALVLTRNG